MAQIDMAYAKSIVEAVEHGCTYEDRCLAVQDLLARHRIASEEAAVMRAVEAARTAVFAVLRERNVDPDTFAYVAQALNSQAIAKDATDAD